MSGFDRFSMVSAMASPLSDYKALVCIFMFGGNDSNNMLVPTDASRFSVYTSKRGALALPSSGLLPINPKSGGSYGLHSSLNSVAPLFKTPRAGQLYPPLALAANVGTLTMPLSKAQYTSSSVIKPYQLFSHSDQQNQWQSGYSGSDIATGWGGAIADKTVDVTGVQTAFPTVCSVAGVSVFSVGAQTQPIAIAPAPTALSSALQLLQADPNQRVTNIVAGDLPITSPAMTRGAADITQFAINNSQALQNAPTPLTTVFPATGLGNQLLQVARMMSLAPKLGLKRQIFFCSIGGFDTHTVQLNAQKSLLQQLGDAMAAFYASTVELQISSNVTTFTLSDFSRTFVPAQTDPTTVGSDHAWGSHHLVMGDSVKGGDIYGAFPDITVGGNQDADTGTTARGRWIPTASVDEYAATLALWYGLSNTDLDTVFPNIGNFTHTQGLGFMT
jgi:uncharacterized protein (DUF1501 family)